MTDADRDRLEQDFVDAYDLRDVIEALAGICYAKADHVRGNWQDDGLAEAWARNGRKLEHLKVTRTW